MEMLMNKYALASISAVITALLLLSIGFAVQDTAGTTASAETSLFRQPLPARV